MSINTAHANNGVLIHAGERYVWETIIFSAHKFFLESVVYVSDKEAIYNCFRRKK